MKDIPCNECIKNGHIPTYICDIDQCKNNHRKIGWKRLCSLHKHFIDNCNNKIHIKTNYYKAFNKNKCKNNNCNTIFDLPINNNNLSNNSLCIKCISKNTINLFNNLNYNNELNQLENLNNDMVEEKNEMKDNILNDECNNTNNNMQNNINNNINNNNIINQQLNNNQSSQLKSGSQDLNNNNNNSDEKQNQIQILNNNNHYNNNLNQISSNKNNNIIINNKSYTIPSFKQIFTSPLRVLKYIPKKIVKLVIRTLLWIIKQVMNYNTFIAWIQLYLFSRVVLNRHKRGGKRNTNRNNNTIKRRCQRVMNGEIIAIYNELIESNNNTQNNNNNLPINYNNNNSNTLSKSMIRKTLTIAEDGHIKKALDMIESNGIANMNDPIKLKLLKSKFPDGKNIRKRIVSDKYKWKKIDSEKLELFIINLNSGSGAGLIGLSNSHLQYLWNNRDGTSLESGLKKYMLFTLNGNINPNVIEWALGPRCIPTNKIKPGRDDDIRPINIDSINYKIATGVAKKMSFKEIQSVIDPTQMSEERCGMEGLVLSFDMSLHYCKSNPECCIVQIDWENFFNEIDRFKMLDIVYDDLPRLYNVVYQLYGNKRKIVLPNGEIIESKQGLDQGQNLSNLRFSSKKIIY